VPFQIEPAIHLLVSASKISCWPFSRQRDIDVGEARERARPAAPAGAELAEVDEIGLPDAVDPAQEGALGGRARALLDVVEFTQGARDGRPADEVAVVDAERPRFPLAVGRDPAQKLAVGGHAGDVGEVLQQAHAIDRIGDHRAQVGAVGDDQRDLARRELDVQRAADAGGDEDLGVGLVLDREPARGLRHGEPCASPARCRGLAPGTGTSG
jgi:hypothetical protein